MDYIHFSYLVSDKYIFGYKCYKQRKNEIKKEYSLSEKRLMDMKRMLKI